MPKKRKIAPQTRNVAGESHIDQVACGANAVATSIAAPITAIIPPTTDIHRRWRAWPAATAAWWVEPGGRVLPQGEFGAAAASEGSGAALRHTPRYYHTSHAPGIALDCCQDCCQRVNRFRTASDRHRTAPQVNAELGQHRTARLDLRIRWPQRRALALLGE